MKSTQHHCETLYFIWKYIYKYVKQHKTCGFLIFSYVPLYLFLQNIWFFKIILFKQYYTMSESNT